jgi:molybdopterin converting factor small subunit
MQVELKLYATLGNYLRAGSRSTVLEVDEGCTVDALLQRLAVPAEQVKLVFINGRHASTGTRLQAGDRIGVFPPVGGG